MTDETTVTRVVRSAALSDPGRVRTNNEDLALLDAERGVFGVIDGVGGHAAGELAAAIARDVIVQRLARPLGTPAERVREAIAIANNEICRRASAEPALAGMTCVVTLATVVDGRVTVGHVGDSRLYLLRPCGIRKLTHDHSPVGEREDAREIGELEAMRHPRRHEVFRDVGSALRDKDEPDYVEIIEATLDDDAAILVCSDGLTDMIPSSMLAHLVRVHAGDAEAVVAALVHAANEAGGRDNVTVVYAEAAGFAAAFTSGATSVGASVDTSGDGPSPVMGGPLPRLFGVRSSWFGLGALLGVLVTLVLAWRLSTEAAVAGRTIAASAQASETVGTLAAAVQAARPGDVIRLEPGTYAESVTVPDGVSLRARVAGTSVFVRPPTAVGEWVAVIVAGDTGGVISGVRVASTPEAPVQVGVRVRGQGRSIELLQIDGPVSAGIEMLADASATLQGSQISVPGPAVVLGARSRIDASGNLFVRTPAAATAPPTVAIAMADDTAAVLRRNVFVGFGASPISGLPESEREHVPAANVVVSANPSTR